MYTKTKVISIIIGILGFCLCFVSDSLPFGTIVTCGVIGAFLMLISYAIMLKHHEKHIKYIKLHFIDDYGNHRYIKAYSYIGKWKAIYDMYKQYYTLYTTEEVI